MRAKPKHPGLTEADLIEISVAASAEGLELREDIDHGGAGSVYAAVNADSNRFAVKILRKPYDDSWLRRFEREATILTRLKLPGLVQIRPPGLLSLGSFKAFAMEYVSGTSLRRLVEDKGPITESEAMRVLASVASVLRDVHRAKVIHRDLHAGNVLLAGDTLDGIKVADFGTARDYSIDDLTEGSKASTFYPVGAMNHCAPEKWRDPHNAGPASDLFSLGVLIYRAVTGKPPFRADTYISLYNSILAG